MKYHKRRKRITKYTSKRAESWDVIGELILALDTSLLFAFLLMGRALPKSVIYFLDNTLGWWFLIIIAIPFVFSMIVFIFTRKYKYQELTHYY